MIETKNLTKSQMCKMYHNMFDRCYRDYYQQHNPAYIGCEVCPEWLDDKENFYDWVSENYYVCGTEQIDLDKDILFKGNKMYSPETCIFAPHTINQLFESIGKNSVYLKSLDKWKSEINVDGKNINLGYFDTEEEAQQQYIRHKEAAIVAKADEYKEKIPKALYDAMVNWKIEPSDWQRKKLNNKRSGEAAADPE